MDVPLEYTNTDDGHTIWNNLPNQTRATERWTVLVLDNGLRLLTFADDKHQAGASVHVIASSGREMFMWDCEEWREDPVSVMGAMLRAAAGVKI